jgi:phosphopantothenoylcysteine decarboxylase/phosphopantothenate--cysteine ligase
VNMWKHPAVRDNLARLLDRGVRVVEPATGSLACGWEGPGRLADPEDVVEEVLRTLAPQDLAGERVLVTAGPTQEPVDPVRYVSNHSSGKMGYALARVARRRGAHVTLVSGPTALPAPRGVDVVPVRTAGEMARAVDQAFASASVVVMTAAVADYRPRRPLSRKLKKTASTLELALERTPDILAGLGSRKGGRLLVGFAAETHLDLIVANDVTAPGAGFGGDTNAVRLIDARGLDEAVPVLPKEEVAERVLDWVAARRPRQRTTTLRPARAPGAPRRSRRSSGRDA